MTIKTTPCSCPTQVPIPVGVFRLCDDGVYEHGPDGCGPCPDLSAEPLCLPMPVGAR